MTLGGTRDLNARTTGDPFAIADEPRALRLYLHERASRRLGFCAPVNAYIRWRVSREGQVVWSRLQTLAKSS